MIRIGIFTDAHYAEGLTACNTRTCWQSMEKVRRIFGALGEADFFIQLGDLINISGDGEQDMKNIRAMQSLLGECGKKCFSVLGNHDVEAARKRVFLPDAERGYYFFEREGVRFIMLDGCFTSDGASYEDAEWDWKDSFIPEQELDWLREALNDAQGKVVVCCHQNLDARPGDPHVIKNAGMVRRLLEDSGKVIAVLQGHCHSGCICEQNGIPYYTFRALCEGDRIPCAMATIDGNKVWIEEKELTEV